MRAWERRLRDLGHLLRSCSDTYFSPDLFRRNTNQFLQTSRTVTFLIQKSKSEIRDFEQWYSKRVVQPWQSDKLMTWARDARNVIEKEGDLELHSSLKVSVIATYDPARDLVVSTTDEELSHATIEKLLKQAIKRIPPLILEEAVLRVERQWVANSLPTHELTQALTYIYARLFEVCHELAVHVGDSRLDESVSHPTKLDPTFSGAARTHYTKLGHTGYGRLKSISQRRDPGYRPPAGIVALTNEFEKDSPPANLTQIVERFAKLAEFTFGHHGNHAPMLLLFNKNWAVIDVLSTSFSDQSDKYVFWRHVADRAMYLRAYGLIWISEVWLRKFDSSGYVRRSEMPITGELLQVVGADATGEQKVVSWEITRLENEKSTLKNVSDDPKFAGTFSFCMAAVSAMQAIHGPESEQGDKT